jgi:hypothetical protein
MRRAFGRISPRSTNTKLEDDPDGQTKFWVFYATHGGKPVDLLAVDAYFLGLNRRSNPHSTALTGDEERYTIGGRVFRAFKGFDKEIESAYQFGQVGLVVDVRRPGMFTSRRRLQPSKALPVHRPPYGSASD